MSGGTRLAGTRVLITGGTRGIGRLMAQGAIGRGAEVVLWARDAEQGDRVAAELGPRASFRQVDVTEPGQVAAASADTGAVDVLVNNAGVVSGKPFLELSEDDVRRTFEANTLAQFRVTRAFLPGMIGRDSGTVVNVASAAGLVGTSRMADYSASKHAVVGFNEVLRAELRGRGSKVSTLVVCPFYIDTGMFAGVRTRVPWLLPILKEADVARKVLDAIESGRRRLLLPPSLHALPVLRLLPTPAGDAVVDLLGVNHTMDGFTGRSGPSA
ncbi:MAG: SDR family oxidoreductase [Propionicimonas sp.]|nr:SDR family oxidoreductase [Propionicimonas sp.]